MEDNEYDEELRWRLELLKVQLEEGKVSIAPHLADDFERSLTAITYLENGLIDLSTVDGRVRSLALMAVVSDNRDKAKEAISLEELSSFYFRLIDENFGSFIQQAKEKNLDAYTYASMVSAQPSAVAEISPQIPKFLEGLGEIWDATIESSHYHIQDLPGTKAVFGGDLFPSYKSNVASSTGLYVDTIILDDPFWRSRVILERSSPETQVYVLLKHAISLSQYRDLALAKVDQPIVVISPNKVAMDEQEADFLRRMSEADGLTHAQMIFGREFGSVEELFAFVKDLDTPEQLVAEVANSDRLLFDTDWTGTPTEQLKRALDSGEAEILETRHAGELVARQCLGRMIQASDVLLRSRYLCGTPLITAPTSWKYFNWKLEYNSASEVGDVKHLHMIQGLQRAATTDMEWLGNIPPDALIEMRQQGAFDEIRDVLSKGIDEIAHSNPDGFFRSSDMIVENIQDAFEQHQENIKTLRAKKLKFAGHDLGTWIATGAIEVAAIATGVPTFGAAAFAINQVVDAPKLKELPERYRNLKNAHQELKKSPMGLFFAHK